MEEIIDSISSLIGSILTSLLIGGSILLLGVKSA